MINEPVTVPEVKIRPGDTIDFPEYSFYDDKDAPIDMSGWSFTASWSPRNSATTEYNIEVDDTEAGSGVLRLKIPSSISLNMNVSGLWSLVMTSGSEVKTVLVGRTVVVRE